MYSFHVISTTSHEIDYFTQIMRHEVIHKINTSLNPSMSHQLTLGIRGLKISIKHLLEIMFKSLSTTIHWLVIHQILSYKLLCNTNVSQHYHAKALYKSKSTCCLHKRWLVDLPNKAGQLGKYSDHRCSSRFVTLNMPK